MPETWGERTGPTGKGKSGEKVQTGQGNGPIAQPVPKEGRDEPPARIHKHFNQYHATK